MAITSTAQISAYSGLDAISSSSYVRPKLVYSAGSSDAPSSLVRGASRHLTIFHQGYMYAQNKRYAKALTSFKRVIDLKPDFAEAYHNRGWILVEIGDSLTALTDFRKAIAVDPNFAEAYFSLGSTLDRLNCYTEAIEAYDDLLARFGTVSEGPLREIVADTLLNKALILRRIDRTAEAMATYDDLVARFDTVNEGPLREIIANTLLSKAHNFHTMGYYAKAIETYEDLVARFDTVSEESLHEIISEALFMKALALNEIGYFRDAIVTLRKARKFESDSEGRQRIDEHIAYFSERERGRSDYNLSKINAIAREGSSRNKINMTKAKALKAAADLLSTVYPADDVRKALEELATKTANEITDQAMPLPRSDSHAPSEKPIAAPGIEATSSERAAPDSDVPRPQIARTASELFGVSSSSKARRYHRSKGPEFSAEELDDPVLLHAADSTVNARTKRTKNGEVLSPEEIEAAQRAARFAKQARKRRRELTLT